MRVKQSLSLQEDACHCEESVCDTADGTSVRVPASTQCGIASAALVIVLNRNACPMVDSVAQSNVRSVAHDYDMRLPAAFRHRRYARQCPERLIVPAAKRPILPNTTHGPP